MLLQDQCFMLLAVVIVLAVDVVAVTIYLRNRH